MKMIVCPFDDSSLASNALEYAKHFSRNTQSRLIIFKKQYLRNLFRNRLFANAATQTCYKGFSSHYIQHETAKRQALAEKEEPIMEMQTICTIAAVARKQGADLIVTGTETEFGFNDLYTDAITNLIKHAQCPLLLIPEGVTFKPIKQIVVVIEHEANITHRIDLLLTLAKLYHANITFLQITKEETQNEHAHFLESWREMYLAFSYENTAFFEMVHGCIPQGIKEFVRQLKTDLLVVIPNMLPLEPYVYSTSHPYNEYAYEPITVPVLAIDSLPMPVINLFINYCN